VVDHCQLRSTGRKLGEHCCLPAAVLPTQIPCETLSWHLERDKTVADGLLELARLREADTLVCGISGYR